jgi:energy-coupling factor transporter ATP-binding protein EcfA2
MSDHSIDIGRLIEVSGERAVFELTVDTTRPLAEGYYPGQPGSYIKVPFRDYNIIGIVTEARVEPGGNVGAGRKTAAAVMIGTLNPDGTFTRGVAVYPNVGQPVQMVGSEEVRVIFSEFVSLDFAFGRLSQAEDQRAYVNVNRLFGQHTAVVGSTGCGKSCTVVSMLQTVLRKYSNTHVVVLDLHGEYAHAFPDSVLSIHADEVELPYWLLSFDEFQDLAVDRMEASAKNQVTVLRDVIVRARQSTDVAERMGLGSSVMVDSPIYFDIDELLGQIRNWNIQMIPDTEGRMMPGPLYGLFDRFLIRFDSRMNDPRYDFMFKSKSYKGEDSLPNLLRDFLSIGTGKRMTIVDLSGVPAEAVGVVVAVVSRIVFEFNLWNPDRDRFPILMVYEEAHSYIPNREDDRYRSCRTSVERILKEGRKHGVGALLVSQRPKELSETVIAQCNNFVAMRLTNPDDQDYVRRLVPDTATGLIAMLPALRTGEAIVLGNAVPMPTRVLVDLPDPMPSSSDIDYARYWHEGLPNVDVDGIIKRWRARHSSLADLEEAERRAEKKKVGKPGAPEPESKPKPKDDTRAKMPWEDLPSS